MFFSQYFSFSLSVPFHHCSTLIHPSIYHPHCIMFFSQYFSFPLSIPFHHCSILIFIYRFFFPEGQMTGTFQKAVLFLQSGSSGQDIVLSFFSFKRPCICSVSQSPASHQRCPGPIPCPSMWNLWWTNWYWDNLCPNNSVFTCLFHPTKAASTP